MVRRRNASEMLYVTSTRNHETRPLRLHQRTREANYLQNLLSRSIYNLEDICPAFRDLPEEEKKEGRLCWYHGFEKLVGYHCALRNACKLKHWILLQKFRVCIDTYSDYIQNSWKSDSDIDSTEVFFERRKK